MAGKGFIVLAAANHFGGLPFAANRPHGLFWCLHDFLLMVEQMLVQGEARNYLFSLSL